MNMKKFLAGYIAGVVTAPAVYYVFRNPIMEHVITPLAMETVANTEWDERLFELMSLRLDFQDFQKKHGEEVRQMKAQGHDISEIAKVMGRSEKAIRAVLNIANETPS